LADLDGKLGEESRAYFEGLRDKFDK